MDHPHRPSPPPTIAPRTTVVICTYTAERLEWLYRAVESVQRGHLRALEIVIVVDHAPELLRRLQRRPWTGVTVVANRYGKGLSGARNTGSAVAKGDLVGFLDDDATAAPDWLARLSLWFDDPRVLGAGGYVKPFWHESSARGFPREFLWAVGCSYTGLPERPAPVRNLFGGCMVVRKSVLEAVGGFREGSGRTATQLYGCEETELCILAQERIPGGTFIYDPQAVIHHYVPEARLSPHYLWRRCLGEGRSKARMQRTTRSQLALKSEQTYLLSVLPRAAAEDAALLLRGDRSAGERLLMRATGLSGALLGYLLDTFEEASRRWRPKKLPPRTCSGLRRD